MSNPTVDQKSGKTNKITAAMVAIGDEILSGRTKDKNIAHIATFLTIKGIELLEVRIVCDETTAIVNAVNELRDRYTYVFTSGGIGPTHDDITSDAIAAAFDVGIGYHPLAFKLLEENYKSRQMPFTKARQKMARIPDGAALIKNPVSVAPGFCIKNVFVMAGVPAVFNAMLLEIEPELQGGNVLLSASLKCNLGEGTIGDELACIADQHPQVSIGSYPRFDGNTFNTEIVVRSQLREAIDKAAKEIEAMLLGHANL